MIGTQRTPSALIIVAGLCCLAPFDARPVLADSLLVSLPNVRNGSHEHEWDRVNIPSLYSSASVYDPVRNRMIVLGGVSVTEYNALILGLELDGSPAWRRLSESQSLARLGHSAVYDPVRDRVIVFGGFVGGYFNCVLPTDTWAIGFSTPLTVAALPTEGEPPPGRLRHVAIYDSQHDRMIVFGGNDILEECSYIKCRCYRRPHYNDTWSLSLAGVPTWSQLEVQGTPPPIPSSGEGVGEYDPLRRRMLYLQGGSLWSLSLDGVPTWTALDVPGTPIFGFVK
ncbi:MAG TPA: hypothetical protein VEY91_12980, partial [Candidatus Limnocylindria bacterium]|nr:hypothetical protein [Candidatus Limnocylindria bacterium]